MNKTNQKKAEQLGMPLGTASHRLRKSILFMLVKETGRDSCFKCSEKIESVEELTIEHKTPWLDSSSDLFWDLDNIAFSHARCNNADRPWQKPVIKHGTAGEYKRGCRCFDCKESNTQKSRVWRERQARLSQR